MAIKQPAAKPATTESPIHVGPVDPITILRNMVLSRECDRRESILVRQGKGIFHVSGSGHEALSVLSYGLRPEDYVFPYYRDRAMMLARGYTVDQIAREFFGTATSTNGGTNLPGHYSSRELNIFPVATPTGSQCIPAAGAAWGIKIAGHDHLVVTTVGDAATRQGEFYEAFAFAVQEMLPILFVVEDNAFGISTRTDRMAPIHMPIFHRAHVHRVDGRSVTAVYEASAAAMDRARRGEGPTILWCEIDRLTPHTSSDDHNVYRSPEEIEAMFRRDPIDLFAAELDRAGILTARELEEMKRECEQLVDTVYLEAMGDPLPTPASVHVNIFGDEPAQKYKPALTPNPDTTMVAEINRLFAARMASDPRMILFGQDIADPKGGVFGFTKGLSTAYPDRVFNSPLAEATIIGAGVGLSATGYRPVFEIQFVDFITPGFNQLAAQVATLRWRSQGDWTCPLVLYMPYGAYLPSGGPWHSQSNEAWFAHIPGLRVGVPSTPEDVVDLFSDAFASEDPTLILVPKHVFRVRMPFEKSTGLGFGKARVRRTGSDVTVVTWGNCVTIALEAAETAAKSGVDVEVLDLRTMVPCDWPAVWQSVGKTKRVVVVHEDARTGGFGQSVIAEIVTGPVGPLAAEPVLLARPDVHIPYHPDLEASILPSAADILVAIRSMLGDRPWNH